MATGYYLGAKAGRQRYDQMNRAIGKIRRSEAVQAAVEEATEKARDVIEEGVEKARSVIEHRGNAAASNGHSDTASGVILPGPGTDPGTGGYSSSR
jgi:hypothetical protein